MTPSELIACIDLTYLQEAEPTDDHPDSTVDAAIAQAIVDLCAIAEDPGPGTPGVAAVCVWPHLVARTRAELTRRGSSVRLATVVAFPSGEATPQERVDEIGSVLAVGADEIDMVLAADALEEPGRAGEELQAARAAAGSHVLKVIIETGRLETGDAIQAATRLAIDGGADFVKSSTGKGWPGINLRAARAMCAEIAADAPGQPVGIKFSGGIRTLAFAQELADIVEEDLGPEWLQPDRLRFGTSCQPTGIFASSQ